MDGGGSNTFRFNPRNANDIFSEFCNVSSPFGGRGGSSAASRSNPQNADRIFSEVFGSPIPSGGMEDIGGSVSSAFMPRKAAAIERMLTCSLEDLYKGTTKKMKISRDVADASGKSTTVEEILPIEIKPGWKKGTKVTFLEKGNEQQGVIPSDLVFIIDEKAHILFKRDDNDLIVTQSISLFDALTGYTAQVTTLDGRNLKIPISNVISPNYEEVVKGEGMPISKEPGKRGNLKIKFNIKFPSRLSSEQKLALRILQ